MTATNATLHPWINSPEVRRVVRVAVEVAIKKQGAKALAIGREELASEGYMILVECAMPRPEDADPDGCAYCGGSLEGVRKGAKFCSPTCRVRAHRAGQVVPAVPLGHIGSMWSWPEAERANWAVREVGHRLANYVVVATPNEIPGDIEDAQGHPGAAPGTTYTPVVIEPVGRTTWDADAKVWRGAEIEENADPAAAYDAEPIKAWHVFREPGYLGPIDYRPSFETLDMDRNVVPLDVHTGDWHAGTDGRKWATDNYYRQSDRVIEGVA